MGHVIRPMKKFGSNIDRLGNTSLKNDIDTCQGPAWTSRVRTTVMWNIMFCTQ